jgi:PIN domain nuclease of toxin-antitoxin system
MVDAVSSPGDRVPFLVALSASNLGEHNEAGRVEAILAALSKWDSPSVNHWRSHQLPRVIVQRFLGLTRLYDWSRNPLKDILAATQIADSEKLAILAEGLEETSLSLGNRALFSISEQMAAFLTPDDAWMIFDWYLKRMVSRVSLDDSAVKVEDIPQSTEESVGRFLFALMGDIDTRKRWRAAHATRRLARLSASATLGAVFAEYDRRSDDAFRDPMAPYYWLAGRLWVVISAARIAHEAPKGLQEAHAKLVSIAMDQTLPHILIREYAKTALIALHEKGTIVLDDPTLDAVRAINVSPFPIDTRDDNATPRLQWSDKNDKRFDFGMDTAEYVLSPILKMLIGLSKDELFGRMEHWLVDQWQTPEKVHYWDSEPRKSRYDERRYGLYHSDKGSMPIIERHGFYLEWHAVLCVVGELMQKYPLWGANDRWGTFQDWFSKLLLTIPPVWLADLRDPRPLEDQFWVEGTPDENRWVSRVARKDFLAALFSENGTDKSTVNVDGSWTSAFSTREVQATISSALVNQATANALVRSLSTRERPRWAYHLPDADSDHEREEGFREMPYKLVGWLVNVRHDDGLDVKDTWRNGIKGQSKSLAEATLAELRLKPHSLPAKTWTIEGPDKIAAQEVVWADLPERYDDHGSSYRRRETSSEGTLLQIDADVLMSFLRKQKMSLIISIHFERRLEQEYGGSYSDRTKKAKTFERFFIFRTDGTIEDDQRTIGTWWRARRTVQA